MRHSGWLCLWGRAHSAAQVCWELVAVRPPPQLPPHRCHRPCVHRDSCAGALLRNCPKPCISFSEICFRRGGQQALNLTPVTVLLLDRWAANQNQLVMVGCPGLCGGLGGGGDTNNNAFTTQACEGSTARGWSMKAGVAIADA